MTEEYDPAFPTDEDVGNVQDDDGMLEKEEISQQSRKKKLIECVLSDATVDSSSASLRGTTSPPPPPPPPPKQMLEQSTRTDTVIPPPPPPQQQMDLFSGLPPPKLDIDLPPPPPPPPNKNDKYKVGLIDQPPPPPPPLPRRFDPYKNLPLAASDELLPPPPPPGDKPKNLSKTKVSYSPPPTTSSCQVADSSFDSTNIAFLSSPPPPPPPPQQSVNKQEDWVKSICTLLAPPPPPPPPPPKEEATTTNISSSLAPHADSNIKNQSKKVVVKEDNMGDLESNRVLVPKECPEPLKLTKSLADSNTFQECHTTVFASHVVEQESLKTGSIWKDSVVGKIDKVVNKKPSRTSKWDIKPQFLQRIEEKQKKAAAEILLPKTSITENASLSESLEEKMFRELEKELVTKKLKGDKSVSSESDKNKSLSDKHQKKDHVLENNSLGDSKRKQVESKNIESDAKSNIGSDVKKQNEVISPTKHKKKKKGLEFKPFVIKTQKTAERIATRGPFQIKSEPEDRDSVVESTYLPPKHMTGKIPSMKYKAKQKADLLDTIKRDAKKELKTTADNTKKFEIKLESNSFSNLDFKPCVKSPLKFEPNVDVKDLKGFESNVHVKDRQKDVKGFEPNVELKELKGFNLKTENKPGTKPSVLIGFKETNVKKIELEKNVKIEAVETTTSFGKELSDLSYAQLIMKSETNVKHTNIISFHSGSSESKLNNVNKIQHCIDSKFDDKISNIKIEPEETAIELIDARIKPVETGNKLVDAETKPVDTETKQLCAGTKPVDTGTNIVDTQTIPVDSRTKQVEIGSKPVDTRTDLIDIEIKQMDLNRCMTSNEISGNVIPLGQICKLEPDEVRTECLGGKSDLFPIATEKLLPFSNIAPEKYQKKAPKERFKFVIDKKIKNQILPLNPLAIEKKASVNKFIDNSRNVKNEGHKAIPHEIESVTSTEGHGLVYSEKSKILEKIPLPEIPIEDTEASQKTITVQDVEMEKLIPVSIPAQQHTLSPDTFPTRQEFENTIPNVQAEKGSSVYTSGTSVSDGETVSSSAHNVDNGNNLDAMIESEKNEHSDPMSEQVSCSLHEVDISKHSDAVMEPVSCSARNVEQSEHLHAGNYPSEVNDPKHIDYNSKYLNSEMDVSGSSTHDVLKSKNLNAGKHPSDVNPKHIDSNSKYMNSKIDVAGRISNDSELKKEAQDYNAFGNISERLPNLSDVDASANQKCLSNSENVSTEIPQESVFSQSLERHLKVPGDENKELHTDQSNVDMIVSQDSNSSQNDVSNQDLSSGTNHSNSDITDSENGDLTYKRKGKRKSWHVDSDNSQIEAEKPSKGRRRSSRIKSLEVKRKESPKTVMEESNKVKNDSKHSSTEHSPVHETTENIETVKVKNHAFTQEDLQQKQEITMTSEVSHIPSKQTEPQTCIMGKEQSQSSNISRQYHADPNFDREDKTHDGEEKVFELLPNGSKCSENKDIVAVGNLDIKNLKENSVEDLSVDDNCKIKVDLLGPGLVTVSEAEKISASGQSGGSSTYEHSEKKHRVKEIPDYKTMGILEEQDIPSFDSIMENIYLTERKRSKASKDARRMLCECTTSSEERRRGMPACGEDCLNRLLMIECSSRCPCGDYCTNKRFQRHEYAKVGVFYSKEKGHGVKALTNIREGTFVMEYCGEVLNFHEFQQRVKQYNKAKQHHFYFMALKTDEIIDATKRGNTSRFINHSCAPNCETQKWTVNGALRVGFFTSKPLKMGEELTFDYQFEVYGEEAQKCYCGADTCRGFIGKRKPQPKGRGESSTPRRRSTQERRKKESFEDISLDEEIEAMCCDIQNDGLQKPDDALRLSRFMVRAETSSQRLKLLQVLQDTKKPDCLKYFLTHHGLALIWSWMVDLGENREELQIQILATLDILPIPHKNMLEDSKVKSVVNKWAQEVALAAKSSEPEVEYSSASETPSRSATPSITTSQNTSNNVPAKEEAVPSDVIIIDENEDDIHTPVREKLDMVDEGVATPKTAKESSEPPKKKLLRHLQNEGVLPVSQLFVASKEKDKDENSTESGSKDELKVGDEICEAQQKENNGKTENTESKLKTETKEGSISTAESETKLSIAKAAASLLESWSTLKEIYIIPKLDKDKEKDRDRKDRDRYHERDRSDRDRDRNRDRDHDRYRERSRERERSRYDRDYDRYRDRDRRDRRRDYGTSRKRSRSHSRERDDRKESESKTLPKLRKPWKDQFAEEPERKRAKEISKQERRQAFEREMEEQILKKEEEKKLKEEMMQQQMMDPYYEDEMVFPQFVDGSGYPIPAHYTVDCNEMPYPMPFPEQGEPGMLPPGIPQDGMMHVDGNDPNAMMYHVDENGVPVQMQMSYGVPHRQGLLPTPPPTQGMMPQDQIPPHGWEPPIFSHQPPIIQDHMLPPPGIPEHMVQPGIPDHMVPPGIQDHMVAENIQPSAQAPSQAQTTTFITHDGMLITQTITPLADPNVHQQLQSQIINQNLTPVAVNSQTSSTSISSIQTVVPTVEDIPSPPKPPPNKLPPNWKTATDSEGKVYYYHALTRQTQWDPPSWDGNDAIPGDDEVEMDLGTPTYDERKHRRTTTAAADTSSETAKKCKDHFRSKMSGYVVTVLNTYRKPDCKIGRITNTEDFKHLARKLTHGIMAKELKHCKNMEDLEVNSNVKHKAKEYIRKYMGRYGSLYRKEPD
ncbi:uncharacterized protein LOC117105068 isoform X2 [Anneissia japonica]|uniref:uncharacterized protein LOC117105068 isoform X2 n=1 Tax=Anneissia japonica TaxID=1529436 RepID=UPI0014256D19|nr:uncharacterized protein LOC117105068 isoform X2 [Anneissia japonica]